MSSLRYYSAQSTGNPTKLEATAIAEEAIKRRGCSELCDAPTVDSAAMCDVHQTQ